MSCHVRWSLGYKWALKMSVKGMWDSVSLNLKSIYLLGSSTIFIPPQTLQWSRLLILTRIGEKNSIYDYSCNLSLQVRSSTNNKRSTRTTIIGRREQLSFDKERWLKVETSNYRIRFTDAKFDHNSNDYISSTRLRRLFSPTWSIYRTSRFKIVNILDV